MNKKEQFIKKLKSAKISKRTIQCFEAVDRPEFFDRSFRKEAYETPVIQIGHGQTSDDPVILAKMIDLLGIKKNAGVLEVGTGSGYSTAILSRLASRMTTVEYIEKLAIEAKTRLTKYGADSISFLSGDATEIGGAKKKFDAVIILAACRLTPQLIIDILVPGGVAVFPMGPSHQQRIVRYVRNDRAADPLKNYEFHDYCLFDSIRGPYGWKDQLEGYFADDSGE